MRGCPRAASAGSAATSPSTPDPRASRRSRAETQALKEAFERVRYAVRIGGARVTVSRYEGEPDYGAEVEQVFARFEQGAVQSYLVKLSEYADMDHVEAQIARAWWRGCTRTSSRRWTDYCSPPRATTSTRRSAGSTARCSSTSPTWSYIAPLQGGRPAVLLSAGLAPVEGDRRRGRLRPRAGRTSSCRDGGTVVTQRLPPAGPERILVVSGPEQRRQDDLRADVRPAALPGQPRPARSRPRARGCSCPTGSSRTSRREEDIETLRGKFEDELVRVHEILEQATGDSVIVMNESFTSTTLRRRAARRHRGDAADPRLGRAGRLRDVRRRARLARPRRR